MTEETLSLYCYRCGNSWKSEGRAPKTCPRCGSSRYGTPVSREAVCPRCGAGWRRGSIDEPCPSCGWTGQGGLLRCNQCDHEWSMRGPSPPKKCPVCRSTRWDQPKLHRFACYRCGHVWRNRAEHPDRCPGCQSKMWDQPALKLQCRRCGYRWIPRRGRSSDEVRMCPSCKSPRWNEAPHIRECARCGCMFMVGTEGERFCSGCRHKDAASGRCAFCGFEWTAPSDAWTICPRCGKARPVPGADETTEFWSDGRRSLRYVFSDGFAFIYLWNGSYPVATRYVHEVLSEMRVTAGQLMYMMSDPRCADSWAILASNMEEHGEDYLGNVTYFTRRLNLSETDAAVLAIHFTGMGPEAIAIRFGMGIEDVRRSFDRIMAAYADSGIVVDDSIFTDDPISRYRFPCRSLPHRIAAYSFHRSCPFLRSAFYLGYDNFPDIIIKRMMLVISSNRRNPNMIGLEVEDYEYGMRSLAVIAGRSARFPTRASGRTSGVGAVNVCALCGYMWEQEGRTKPGRCPSCRSTRWDRYDLKRHKCNMCSYRWMSADESPSRCPGCHSRQWSFDVKRYECGDCGRISSYKIGGSAPSVCPDCGSSNWGCERVRCTCRRCGFNGTLIPGCSGICPVCGTEIRPTEPISAVVDLSGMGGTAAGILEEQDDECLCVRSLMAETGLGETEARAAFMIRKGIGEVQVSRTLGLSFDSVRRISLALEGIGVQRAGRAGDAACRRCQDRSCMPFRGCAHLLCDAPHRPRGDTQPRESSPHAAHRRGQRQDHR